MNSLIKHLAGSRGVIITSARTVFLLLFLSIFRASLWSQVVALRTVGRFCRGLRRSRILHYHLSYLLSCQPNGSIDHAGHTHYNYDLFPQEGSCKIVSPPGVAQLSCLVKVKCFAPALPMNHTQPWTAPALPTSGLLPPARGCLGCWWRLPFTLPSAGLLKRRDWLNRKRPLFHNFWPSLAIL
jgi:hypothetical protein